MNVLKTAKVVVIDDRPEEAMPVLKALGKIGVGAIYFSGDPDELPEAPLKGIRMLFLDLNLGGAGGNVEQIIGQTLSVLEKLIAKEPSPLAIIAWTKHKDYVDALKKKLQQEWNVLVPGFVANLEKPHEFNEDAISLITEKFSELVLSSFPLELLWSWEQLVHDAAVETTSSLAALATTDSTEDALPSWNSTMSRILGKLGIAVAGQQLSEEALLQDIFAALNPVHMDHLERKSSVLDLESDKIRGLFETARDAQSDGKAEARLNSKLLIAEINDNGTKPSPGIIYEPGDTLRRPFPLSRERGLFDSIVRDIFNKDILAKDLHSIYRDIINLKRQEQLSENQKNRLRKLRAQRRLIQRIGIKPIVLEITPPCDFSQRKNRMARFVGGLWVPQEMKDFIKRHATFLKEIGPLAINASKSLWYLVLDSHFLFGYREEECIWRSRCRLWKARHRLRSQVLVDVQAWFASHAARPGYTSVTP